MSDPRTPSRALRKRLSLPLIAAPMLFLVSGVDLVVAVCGHGVIRFVPHRELP